LEITKIDVQYMYNLINRKSVTNWIV